jgi:hypothetical protein
MVGAAQVEFASELNVFEMGASVFHIWPVLNWSIIS